MQATDFKCFICHRHNDYSPYVCYACEQKSEVKQDHKEIQEWEDEEQDNGY